MERSSSTRGSSVPAVVQDSSRSSAADNNSQHYAANPVASCDSILDHRLQSTLLRHPSISQDQQVVAALLQTSQQLQAAAAQLLPGQLPVVLHARKLQQVTDFAQWLQKHGGLVQKLAVHLAGGSVNVYSNRGWRPAEAEALTAAMQQATTATDQLSLHSFAVRGALASSDLLQQLPAAHLTQLHAEVTLRGNGIISAGIDKPAQLVAV
jgi:hypothetical protein